MRLDLIYPQTVNGETKFYKHPVEIEQAGDNLEFRFRYNEYLKNEIKAFQGARWNPDKKIWTATNCSRNLFQLSFLSGHNPYKRYDAPLVPFISKRKVYAHQCEMTQHILTRKQCICAVDTGLGKTLAAIEAFEILLQAFLESGAKNWWWVGPRSALYSVQLEFLKWKMQYRPRFISYDELKRILKDGNEDAPQFVVFDESQKAKTPTSQTAQACYFLAEQVRRKWQENAYVILMSGTPAPKSPLDWYYQCFSGNTWILTDKGHRQAKNLINQSCNVFVDGKLYNSPTGTFITGRKELFRICTKEGYSFEATLDHPILCEDYLGNILWKTVQELRKNEKLCLNEHENISWSGEETWKEGYLLGLLLGDGSISKNKSTKSKFDSTISVWPIDYKNIPFILSCFVKYAWEKQPDVNYQGDTRANINTVVLDKLRAKFEITTKQITPKIEQSSKEFLAGLLSGLFDTDGTVEKKRLRVRLNQSNFDLLQAVQRILLSFGIPSKILFVKKKGFYKFQEREIYCKDHYVLLISGVHVKKFQKEIDFRFEDKREKLKNQLNVKSQMSPKFIATFEKLEPLGEQEVYDINVPGVETFSGNGLKLHNCEIACPGFIREGDINKFKFRLALVKKIETGYGAFPKLITWWDDENKCKKCGKFEQDESHDISLGGHIWEKSKNEVQHLYERLKGLVLVKLKKDCLDLPPKMYEVIRIKPSKETLRLADLVDATADRTITKLTLWRELSDGFQYRDVQSQDKVCCPTCRGSGEVDSFIPELGINNPEEQIQEKVPCFQCNGEKEIFQWRRDVKEVTSPKESVLEELLEKYEDYGRIVIAAAFTASIDKCVNVVTRNNWNYIRIDGRGWHSNLNGSVLDLLLRFQEGDITEKIAIVLHAASGSTGLTLTASPVIVRYSNDFNGANFFQLEDRIYRIGTKGAKYIDLVHLPSDEYVLENLQKKRKLQDLSMGNLNDYLKNVDMSDWREVE